MSTDTLKRALSDVTVADARSEPGVLAAKLLAERLLAVPSEREVALWLMAAPSGFAFYDELVSLAFADPKLAQVLGRARYFQFDDYPIGRESPRFPATFRYLLETRLFRPLEEVVGAELNINLMELTDDQNANTDIVGEYEKQVLAAIGDPNVMVFEIKGTGMDGHWGFHGAETPLAAAPGIMSVEMGGQNVRQQMLDWPSLFPTADEVPRLAYTFNVQAFLRADCIIDVTPQPEKEFAVLACYCDEMPHNEVPSSALKLHPDSTAFIGADAARSLKALLERRAGDPEARLNSEEIGRLSALWDDPEDQAAADANRASMMAVLRALNLID